VDDLQQTLVPLGTLLAGLALGWASAGTVSPPPPPAPAPPPAMDEAQEARCATRLQGMEQRAIELENQAALLEHELSEAW